MQEQLMALLSDDAFEECASKFTGKSLASPLEVGFMVTKERLGEWRTRVGASDNDEILCVCEGRPLVIYEACTTHEMCVLEQRCDIRIKTIVSHRKERDSIQKCLQDLLRTNLAVVSSCLFFIDHGNAGSEGIRTRLSNGLDVEVARFGVDEATEVVTALNSRYGSAQYWRQLPEPAEDWYVLERVEGGSRMRVTGKYPSRQVASVVACQASGESNRILLISRTSDASGPLVFESANGRITANTGEHSRS